MKQKSVVTDREAFPSAEWERDGCQVSFEILLVDGNNNESEMLLLLVNQVIITFPNLCGLPSFNIPP